MRLALVLASLFLFTPALAVDGSPATADGVREAFAVELAHQLLGGDTQYVQLSNNQGWLGVVLAPPGTSLAALSEAYDGQTGEVIRSVTNISSFDQPIFLQGGYGCLKPISIATVWDDFLKRATPHGPVNKRAKLESNTLYWLFASLTVSKPKPHVAYDYNRPSEFVVRYKGYEEIYDTLLAGKGSELWHLHPALKRYKTYNEARQQVMAQWVMHGYKVEVETATKQYQAYKNGSAWRAWSAARAAFDNSQVPLTPDTQSASTFLLPPPASWSEVGIWLRAETRASTTAGPISFQMARIKVARPWLQFEDLLSGTYTIDKQQVENASYVLSDGSSPSYDNIGNGSMNAIIEELILVRNIRPRGSSSELSIGDHPLTAFSNPDAVNLIGYVVRVFPAIPSNIGEASAAEIDK
jgi:hypothetical protein